MTNKQIEKYDELLIELMVMNHVTHDDVKYCAALNMSEIEKMIDIFEHKTPRDQQLTLELLKLLAEDRGSEIIEFYTNEFNINFNLDDTSREDIVLLLTACLYNKRLFYYALNVCEEIEEELPEEEDSIETEINEEQEIKSDKCEQIIIKFMEIRKGNQAVLIILGPEGQGSLVSFKQITRHAAPEIDKTILRNVLEEPIQIAKNGINGKLYLKGNDKQAFIEVVFDEHQDKVPFGIKFSFKTKHEPKEHEIVISIDRKPVIDPNNEKIKAINSEKILVNCSDIDLESVMNLEYIM